MVSSRRKEPPPSDHASNRPRDIAARGIEEACTDPYDQAQFSEHRGLVSTAVMQCAAALETEAHEICAYGPGSYDGSGSTAARDFLKPLAEIVDDQDTLGRFDLILHVLEKPPILKDREPYQSTAMVVRLRNELTQYKSRWGSEMTNKKFFIGLEALKHKPSPFAMPDMLFFPHRCLSAECAAWAVVATVEYLEAVYRSLGVNSRFEQYRSRLVPW